MKKEKEYLNRIIYKKDGGRRKQWETFMLGTTFDAHMAFFKLVQGDLDAIVRYGTYCSMESFSFSSNVFRDPIHLIC